MVRDRGRVLRDDTLVTGRGPAHPPSLCCENERKEGEKPQQQKEGSNIGVKTRPLTIDSEGIIVRIKKILSLLRELRLNPLILRERDLKSCSKLKTLTFFLKLC